MGNAVTRNKIKRRLKSIIVENLDNFENASYVLLAKIESANVSYSEIKRDLIYCKNKYEKHRGRK